MRECVLVCERERERKGERVHLWRVCLCLFVCVSEYFCDCLCMSVCVWVRERKRRGHSLSLSLSRKISILVCLGYVKLSVSSKRLMTVLCINTMKSCRVTSQCYKFEHDQVFLRPLVTQFYAFSEKKSPKPILNYKKHLFKPLQWKRIPSSGVQWSQNLTTNFRDSY